MSPLPITRHSNSFLHFLHLYSYMGILFLPSFFPICFKALDDGGGQQGEHDFMMTHKGKSFSPLNGRPLDHIGDRSVMPVEVHIDRGEMELLTQGQKGLTLGGAYAGLTSSDPFEALTSISSLLDTDTDTTQQTKEDDVAPSYFKLFEDDTDEDYKSESGKKILGEFTSLFKGFS